MLDDDCSYSIENGILNISSEGHLTLRLLMSYIYGAPNLDVSRSHTTTQHGKRPKHVEL